MTRKLIVNADDFGIGRKTSDAIIKCHEGGIVSSTTLMANMAAAEYAAEKSKVYPELGVGVHLVLTQGKPILSAEKVPDLVDSNGFFLNSKEQAKQLWRGRKVFNQVRSEFNAQILRVIEMGVSPTHCDSHHGIHRMPLAREAVGEVINNLQTPRLRNQLGYYWAGQNKCFKQRSRVIALNSRYIISILGHLYNRWTLRKKGVQFPDFKVKPEMMIGAPENEKEALIKSIESLKNGISEMIFHPGSDDNMVLDSQKFAMRRLLDFKLLTDVDVIAAVKRNNINLINFSNI